MSASVRALALRPPGSPRPVAVDSVQVIAGLGFAGDRHAAAHSPRQLLLVDAAVYDDYALPPHALCENLLLDLDTGSLASGTVLQLGEGVRVRVMFQCEACGQLDVVRPGLAHMIGKRRGVLARVLSGGFIHCGDSVRDLGVLHPAWSDDWRERVRRVLDAVPPDAVVEYAQLARLAGVQSSYCRAFPRLLASLGQTGRAVPAQSNRALLRWTGEGLFERS